MTNNSKIIDWQSLDPKEVGEDMVDAIRNLNSDNPEVRMESLIDLFDISWHQGTSGDRALIVIPFLREFLPNGTEREKERILVDLAHLATGCAYEYKEIILFLTGENQLVLEQKRKEELEWMRDLYEEVCKGVNVYLDLLEDDSAKVRIAAAYALSCCPKDADKIIPQLQQRFDGEPDELVKVTIPLCLTFLSKTAPVDAGFFEQILNSNETDFVKLSAAVSLVYLTGKEMSDSVLNKLVKLLEIPELFNRLEEHYYMMTMAHNWMVLDFFHRLGEKQMAKVIPILTRAVSPYSLDMAIEVPFRGEKIPEGTTFENLTESQQFVLRAIANDEDTWKGRSTNTIVTSIIGIKGSSPQEQRQKLIYFINGETLKYDR